MPQDYRAKRHALSPGDSLSRGKAISLRRVPLTRSSEGLSAVVLANIRAELARRRISHRQLAMRLGITPEFLSRRMRNEVPLGVEELGAIADVLGVSVELLLRRQLVRQSDPISVVQTDDRRSAGAA